MNRIRLIRNGNRPIRLYFFPLIHILGHNGRGINNGLYLKPWLVHVWAYLRNYLLPCFILRCIVNNFDNNFKICNYSNIFLKMYHIDKITPMYTLIKKIKFYTLNWNLYYLLFVEFDGIPKRLKYYINLSTTKGV